MVKCKPFWPKSRDKRKMMKLMLTGPSEINSSSESFYFSNIHNTLLKFSDDGVDRQVNTTPYV